MIETKPPQATTLFDLIGREWALEGAVIGLTFNAGTSAVACAMEDGTLTMLPVADSEHPEKRIRMDLETGRTTIRPREGALPQPQRTERLRPGAALCALGGQGFAVAGAGSDRAPGAGRGGAGFGALLGRDGADLCRAGRPSEPDGCRGHDPAGELRASPAGGAAGGFGRRHADRRLVTRTLHHPQGRNAGRSGRHRGPRSGQQPCLVAGPALDRGGLRGQGTGSGRCAARPCRPDRRFPRPGHVGRVQRRGGGAGRVRGLSRGRLAFARPAVRRPRGRPDPQRPG